MIDWRLACIVALAAAYACTARPSTTQDTARAQTSTVRTSEATVAASSASPIRSPALDSEPSLPPCSRIDPSVASGSSNVRNDIHVALVDSAWAGEAGDIGILLFKVEVQTGAKADTIPGIRAATMPGVSPAGKIHIIAFKSESNIPDDAEVYDPVPRTLTSCAFPDGLDSQHPSISPDALYVAYIGWDAARSGNFGVVKKWSDSTVLVETPLEPWYKDDVDYNGVRWRDATHVEFAYRSGQMKNRWIHAVVSVDDRNINVDSLSSQPSWAR